MWCRADESEGARLLDEMFGYLDKSFLIGGTKADVLEAERLLREALLCIALEEEIEDDDG